MQCADNSPNENGIYVYEIYIYVLMHICQNGPKCGRNVHVLSFSSGLFSYGEIERQYVCEIVSRIASTLF